MRIESDEFGEWLRIDGEEYGPVQDREFELPASRMREAKLSDVPPGVVVRLCDRVVGSSDLYGRWPHCTFEHTKDGILQAHVETAFLLERDDIEQHAGRQFLRSALDSALRRLEPLISNGRVTSVEESVYDEIAYLTFSMPLQDQLLLDAESFVGAVESRIQSDMERPLLFVCHASEDKPFVDVLVSELDRRALHVWYDRREVLVGDSIVQRVNEALEAARFVVVVLSPKSVAKPWVKRELNSTLMRQLAEQNVSLLPVLAEDCEVPPLLVDLKYADFRTSFAIGLKELLNAVRGGETSGS